MALYLELYMKPLGWEAITNLYKYDQLIIFVLFGPTLMKHKVPFGPTTTVM